MKIFYKDGALFKIDEKKLNPKANTLEIKNALYAAVYEEFKGAVKHDIYKKMNLFERMDELNRFAEKWLKDRNLL